MLRAYCYASGQITFRRKRGTLPIGRLKCTKEKFETQCRLAYDGKTLLVPGVPEAPDQSAGVAALDRFIDRLLKLDMIE